MDKQTEWPSAPMAKSHDKDSLGHVLLRFLLCCAGGFALAMVASAAMLPLAEAGAGVAYLHLVQWAQTLLLMILPPVVWVRLICRQPLGPTLRLSVPRGAARRVGVTLLWVSVIMVVAVPLLEWLAAVGERLPLPAAVEAWARGQQVQSEALLAAMMSPSGWSGWLALVSLVVLATALGEELMFRGALLNIFLRDSAMQASGGPEPVASARRRAVAAVAVGLVFALIHFDVYGLLPRWALGTLFAYFVLWSGSLWPAVWAHALNNLFALLQYKLWPETMDAPLPGGWVAAAASAVLTGAAVWMLRRHVAK